MKKKKVKDMVNLCGEAGIDVNEYVRKYGDINSATEEEIITKICDMTIETLNEMNNKMEIYVKKHGEYLGCGVWKVKINGKAYRIAMGIKSSPDYPDIKK